METENQSTKTLKIVFGGSSHDIDADILIEALVNYSIVAQEASAYLSPDSKINIRIKATQEGSFELLMDVVASVRDNLFTTNDVVYAAGLVTIVGGLYSFKQWLSKNGAPEMIEKNEQSNVVKIKNDRGEITINNNVYNIYQSSDKARTGLKNTFTKLKDTEEIEDFEIIDQESGEEIFRISKEDFAPMASDIGEVEQRKQKEVRTAQELSVFKIVFKENHKWEFFYGGNRIYATIGDMDFVEKVGRGEVAFRSGDRMVADIEIVQVFNEAANVFVNEQYFVTKVLKHIPRSNSTQETLGFIKTEDDEI